MGTRLYVGNLNFATTEDQLRTLVETNGGQVVSVHMVTDRETGRPRGFAFVEVANAQQAGDVIGALHGKSVDGRTLTVNEAREREGVRGGGNGGGRGARNGRGGRY
jgi:RNA recognition motif-containing protein